MKKVREKQKRALIFKFSANKQKSQNPKPCNFIRGFQILRRRVEQETNDLLFILRRLLRIISSHSSFVRPPLTAEYKRFDPGSGVDSSAILLSFKCQHGVAAALSTSGFRGFVRTTVRIMGFSLNSNQEKPGSIKEIIKPRSKSI